MKTINDSKAFQKLDTRELELLIAAERKSQSSLPALMKNFRNAFAAIIPSLTLTFRSLSASR